MHRKFIVTCPAKVNRFLAVGPRDERGYHPLRTIFQAIDLCDLLEVELAEGETSFSCIDPQVPAENTVTKALRLLKEVVNLPPMRIVLHKHIPVESGLGGGSSDAAGILRLAKRLAPGAIPDGELFGIAAAVGADVPFFLAGGRAKGEGYGERLTSLPDAPTEWIVLARPSVGCGTAEAYRRLDALEFDWREFGETALYNDFERVAPSESLDLIARLRGLGATDAALSGSGSAVFGLFDARQRAEAAQVAILAAGAQQAWAVRTLTRSESLAIFAG
jgi:4-diphosphocytidyl-2-C-methyl-D-erythritol kinase